MGTNASLRASIVLGIICVGVTSASAAEMYITPAVLYTDDDKARGVEDDLNGGQVSLGWVLSERLSLEGSLAYSDLGGINDLKIWEGSLNMLISLSPGSRLSPYLLGGVGMMNSDSKAMDTENSALGNLGLGLMYRFGDSPVSLRLEHRARFETANTRTFTDRITSLGLQFAFGANEAPVVMPPVERDGDADGVPDSRDACPDTPAGQRVDARGCPPDSDGDGVSDNQDQCPNTFRRAKVDATGCEFDDDKDRIVNRLDECPNTRAGARVDIKGCEIREVIELPGVNFETNSDRLLAGAEQVLIDAAATLKLNPDLVVEVAGHTDSAGSDAYNASLSERRAKTVRDYLINRGANSGNLTTKGYGEAAPVADNATAEGRARNRRVELRIQNR